MTFLYVYLSLPLFVSVAAQSNDGLFDEFKSQFQRVYATAEEEEARREAFNTNMALAAKLQKLNPSATYGHLSPFADRTNAELEAFFVPLPFDFDGKDASENSTLEFSGPPSEYDSQIKGYVTEIKDQAVPESGCNSCWTWVTAAMLETGVARQHGGKLVDLSPQQVIDCDYRGGGCGGGDYYQAFEWLESMSYGLESLVDYPYTAKQGKCEATRAKMLVRPSTHYLLKSAEQMKGACYELGAVGTGLNGGPIMLNKGGLIDLGRSACDPKKQTHAITIIGYGTQDGIPFWRFKNTWGDYWGDAGYGKIRRGSNTCGIEVHPVGMKVKKPRSEIVV